MRKGVYMALGAAIGMSLTAVVALLIFWTPKMACRHVETTASADSQTHRASAPAPDPMALTTTSGHTISPQEIAELMSGKIPAGMTQADIRELPKLIARRSQAQRLAKIEADHYAQATVGGVAGGPVPTHAEIDAKLAEESKPHFEAPLPPPDGPPVLRVNPETEATEDAWLGHIIVGDILAQLITGLHLSQPASNLRFMVKMNTDEARPKVRIDLMNWADNPKLAAERFNEELPLDFAWDAEGYSVATEYLLGTHPLPALPADPDAPKLLGSLLNLTGPVLAREDVRISAALEKNPLDATAQGEAALLLTAFAWRENAGGFSDARKVLSKATAHLAIARAVDNLTHEEPDWNARVADAALRTLAGREADALQHIDALAAQKDAPGAAQTWLAALRLRATGDWRPAVVTADSALLTKIAWFQVLCDQLGDLAATARLDKAGDLAKVPDWGRALFSHNLSVESGNRFGNETLELEIQEAIEVSKAENQPIANQDGLASALAASDDDTVTIDAVGQARVRVVGPNTFAVATRRHLFNSIVKVDEYLGKMLGAPEEAAQFAAQMTSTFGKLPFFDLVRYQLFSPDNTPRPLLPTILRPKGLFWDVSEVPVKLAFDFFFYDGADTQLVNDFYASGEPCGTVHDFRNHLKMIRELRVTPRWHLSYTQPDATKVYEVIRNYLQQLQTLSPDSVPVACELVDCDHGIDSGLTATQALGALRPFMDYSSIPESELLGSYVKFSFTNEELETIYRKSAVLDPDANFALGKLLRTMGRADDAAEADRKGVAEAFDQVGVANSLQPLINYDEAHGKMDEAAGLAKRGADVGSASGLESYSEILAQQGHLDAAESQAKEIKDRYEESQPLINLYLAHPEHFRAQLDALTKEDFPLGKVTVSLNSFSGPPARGAVFTSNSQLLNDSGLEEHDVVVALNATKVENVKQYDYLRGENPGNDMDLIVWHEGQYAEIHAAPPNRAFQVEMSDYPPK